MISEHQHVTTPRESVVRMLALCEAQPGESLIDLGSADGRIPIAAASLFGVSRAVGVEVDPSMVARASSAAAGTGVASRASFVCGDMFSAPLGEFSIVTIFQSESAIESLVPKLLREVRPGATVVSYMLPLGSMAPLRLLRPTIIAHPFYLYRGPLEEMDEEESASTFWGISRFAAQSESEWARVAAQLG